MSKMIEAARRALRSVDRLHESFHQPILDALHAEGVIDGNGGAIRASASSRIARVEAAAANDPQIRQALRYAGSKLRRCGVEFDDIVDHERGEVSVEKLNSVMAKANKNTDFKIAMKTALAVAGVID